MKLTKKIGTKAFAAVMALCAAQQALAQDFNFQTMATTATDELKNTIAPIISIVKYLVLLIGVVMLVWNYIKRAKNDGQGNDALVSWGFGLIFVFVAIQIIQVLVR